MFRFIVLLFFVVYTSLPVAGQKTPLVFHNLTVADGLSENTIRSIVEDSRGYMWFGCEDGLNKYNGYEFEIYRSDDSNPYSISSRNITHLYQDSKKRLWIVTSNGLNLYDPILNLFYNYKNNKYPALKYLTGIIEGLTEDNKGNLWVSTRDRGLFKVSTLDKAPKRMMSPFIENCKHLDFLLQEDDSTLMIGTWDGLFRFNILTEKFTDLRPLYGRGYEVRSMYKDGDKNLWISTTEGLKIISKQGFLTKYQHDEKDPHTIGGNNLNSVIPYREGVYLIGIDGAGVDLFDSKKNIFHHYSEELSSPNTNSIYKDSKGDIWVGTYLNGMNYSNTTTNLFVLKKNNPYSKKSIKKGIITGFLKDVHKNLWVSTDGGGLYKKTPNGEHIIHYEAGSKGLSSNVIITMREDKQQQLWLSTYGGGVCKYDPALDSFLVYKNDPLVHSTLFNNFTKSIIDYDDRIWICGYGGGMSLLNKKTNLFKTIRHDKFDAYSIPTDWVHLFYPDKDSTLWLGTFEGLAKYDTTAKRFINYKFKNKDSDNQVDINTIIDILEDSQGNFWIGTMGAGLVLFDKKTGAYKNYTAEKDGLSNNCIKSIVEDDLNNLWLATNNGITRFNVSTRKGKAYTVKDGLPHCAFYFNSKYKDETGKIYFGSNNGYLIIDPVMTGINKIIPPVVITKFKIFNELISASSLNSPLVKDISETDEIVLNYKQSSITLEFAALNFNSAQNNKYAYWLEGFDKTWFYTSGQRTATYTNLNPGTYIFHVKGSNNDNVWNNEGRTITITITPPYWKTWWFNLICVALVLTLLYLVYSWRTSLIRTKNTLLEKIVKQRTSELEEANERLETFVYKASHDIKGPLKSIMGLTIVGQRDVQDESARNYFDHILKSTRKLDNLLMDLLQITKVRKTALQLEKINFNEMVASVLSSFENFPGYEKMKISLEIKENVPFYSDKKLFHSIVQNLIENPIKYLDPKKSVNTLDIKISVTKKMTELVFTDNGVGISKENQKHIFDMFFKASENANGTGLGLYIVKTTVEKLQGTILLESEPGKGSTFTVRF
jgi:two-component system, sensor histidine kinase ChiS